MKSSKNQCPACDGSGLENRTNKCQLCHGSGYLNSQPGWDSSFPGSDLPNMPDGPLGGRCPHCQANLKIDEPHSRACPYGRKSDIHELEDWNY